MDKFNNKFRISSARLKGYDYSAEGIYFITICTKKHFQFFGKITKNEINVTNDCIQKKDFHAEIETHNYASLPCNFHYTRIGEKAIEYWKQIPLHFPFVELDEYIVMPNHIHGILYLNNLKHKEWQPNLFMPQSQNLASVIRGFKSSLKRYANQYSIEFDWQSRYYDEIIRDEETFLIIRRYIEENPENWCLDKSTNDY